MSSIASMSGLTISRRGFLRGLVGVGFGAPLAVEAQ
jgi:hypothetical protein